MITMPVLSIFLLLSIRAKHLTIKFGDELGIGQDVQSLSVPVNGAF